MLKKTFVICVLATVIVAAGASADNIAFDMLNPGFSGGAYLNDTVDGRSGVATIGVGSALGASLGGVWENPGTLNTTLALGQSISEIDGFSFDYYIHDDGVSTLSGGARMTMYVFDSNLYSSYSAASTAGDVHYLHFDLFAQLPQTRGVWHSSGNILAAPSPVNGGHAAANTLYAGYKTWEEITTEFGNYSWHWMGILQDNAGATVSFDNVAVSANAPIPEPATLSLLGMGLAGLVARSRRSKKEA